MGVFSVNRPDWDTYFMNIAQQVAARANCIRRQIGAVLVRDKQIISTGYNGTPRGIKNCFEGYCARCASSAPSGTSLDKCSCCHAEENAIVQAARHGMRTEGATLYTTFTACTQCAKMIINAGIKKVVAKEDYPDDLGTRLLKEAGVELIRV
ncbi:MAG: cytidine/deoxycytidylate deaminase family protein [Candidatus Aenigmarchaeota archaeon]|nr:cytidine/deoxycytidylate deaminase family protein [Candidatus Aenigmarchaeota archaeon]